MTAAYKIDKDLSEAQQMVDGLEVYVRGTDLYGHTDGLFGSGDSPALTIGAFLLRLRRLEAKQEQLNTTQRSELRVIHDTWYQVRNEWRVHYESKLLQEAKSRLDNVNTYVVEAMDSPRTAHVNYATEALRRTIVGEVLREMETLGIESAEVHAKRRDVDSKLRGLVQSVPFQWDEGLQDVYPDLEFWWLYQAPEDITVEK